MSEVAAGRIALESLSLKQCENVLGGNRDTTNIAVGVEYIWLLIQMLRSEGLVVGEAPPPDLQPNLPRRPAACLARSGVLPRQRVPLKVALGGFGCASALMATEYVRFGAAGWRPGLLQLAGVRPARLLVLSGAGCWVPWLCRCGRPPDPDGRLDLARRRSLAGR